MIIHSDEIADITVPGSPGPMRVHVFRPNNPGRFPGVLFFSEIYQVTDPIRRLAALLAGQSPLGAGFQSKKTTPRCVCTAEGKDFSMHKTVVQTINAPAALGPYSQAIAGAGLMFCAGQLPIDPASGAIPPGIAAQTRQCLANIAAVLEAGGASIASVVKTTVFLKDMDQFAAMNEVYATVFTQSPPARSTVEVARLPRDALVEIEATALLVAAP